MKDVLDFARKNPNEIPIVGQLYNIEGWFVTLAVKCNCEKGGFFMIAGSPGLAAAQCPSCKAIAKVTKMEPLMNGDVTFHIERLKVEAADAPAG